MLKSKPHQEREMQSYIALREHEVAELEATWKVLRCYFQ